MEVRASYVLVGAVVLALLAALAGFSVWLVTADIDEAVQAYQIVFEGSVTGLEEGAQVEYRGVPVGRVDDIRINPLDVEEVLVTALIDRATPITTDTYAVLELQGVTGIAYVQLRGGTQTSEPLLPDPEFGLPQIPSRPSALERVFQSGPELLASGLELAGRLAVLLRPENLAAASATLRHLETFTEALAAQSEEIEVVVGGAAGAVTEVAEVSNELGALVRDLRDLTERLDRQLEGVGGEAVGALAELRGAADALGGAASGLEGLLGDVREPLDDFAGAGLYDFSQLIAETRNLVAALSRITTEFERDPTGFLLGGNQGGFEPR